MGKILTIVVPTYNMEKYLDKCLTSLIVNDKELLKRLEVLVVIDGAKDRSSEIAHVYQDKYPDTFRVIDKENGNYGSCINRGLKEATGKYIKVLDADDWFDTMNFESFLTFLLTTEVDCVISDMVKVTDKKKILSTISFDLPPLDIVSMKEFLNVADNIWMHCVCYLTDNLRSINYKQTEGISYTDQEWLFLPMSTCKKITYFNRVVYNYLVGRNGQTVDPCVWDKNFWMELDGLYVMMEQRHNLYENVPNDSVNYLDIRLNHRIRAVYTAYLLRFSSDNNRDKMIEFDKRLKNYDSNLYEKIGQEVRKCKMFRYVRYWRSSYNRNSIYMSIVKSLDCMLNFVG